MKFKHGIGTLAVGRDSTLDVKPTKIVCFGGDYGKCVELLKSLHSKEKRPNVHH